MKKRDKQLLNPPDRSLLSKDDYDKAFKILNKLDAEDSEFLKNFIMRSEQEKFLLRMDRDVAWGW